MSVKDAKEFLRKAQDDPELSKELEEVFRLDVMQQQTYEKIARLAQEHNLEVKTEDLKEVLIAEAELSEDEINAVASIAIGDENPTLSKNYSWCMSNLREHCKSNDGCTYATNRYYCLLGTTEDKAIGYAQCFQNVNGNFFHYPDFATYKGTQGKESE